jgi:hypothetical protein
MCAKSKRCSMITNSCIFFFFVSVTTVFAATIVPMGKVSIVSENNVIGYFDQVAQLPEGYRLRCEAKCLIQLDNVDMAVEPKTTFSFSQMTNHHYLTVEQGTVHYTLNKYSQPLHFQTPLETVIIDNLQMHSAELKGYVRSSKDVTEIGVLGGGTMTLGTGADKRSVLSGEKLTISAASEEKTAFATQKTKSGTTKNNYTIEGIDNNNDRVSQVFGDPSRSGRASGGGSEGGRASDGGSRRRQGW